MPPSTPPPSKPAYASTPPFSKPAYASTASPPVPFKQRLPFCLASSSPRRKQLLAQFGLKASVFDPQVDETQLPGETPQGLTTRLATLKAKAALASHPKHLILAGDTVVALGSAVYGKPTDAAHAKSMLTSLCGRTHQVITGCCLLHAPSATCDALLVATRVRFRQVDARWLEWYANSGEPLDKAGGYGIQGWGSLLVEAVEGSYWNVMGFPIEQLFWHLWQKGWITL